MKVYLPSNFEILGQSVQSETAVRCTASYFVKIIYCSCWFWTPPLFWGWILLILRSPKGGCCSISDDLSCSWIICCTRYYRPTFPLTLTFNLLTWISIGIIYLPYLKLLDKAFLSFSLQKVKGDRHPTDGPTYQQTDWHVPRNMPWFFEGGHNS